jgi:cytidine deaminase
MTAPTELEALVAAAEAVQKQAHVPYSKFRVGAALLAEDGQIYAGCNVENASFGATVCAERSAVSAMVAAGARRIQAIAVVTDGPEPVMPCGICRQVLLEFADDTVVLAVTPSGEKQTTLVELLPEPFIFKR